MLTSLGLVIAAYLALSRYERNYVNILMPFMLIGIPNFYLFELVYGVLLGFEGSTYAYVYTYVTHAAGVLAKTLAYIATPAVVLPLLIRLRRFVVPAVPVLLLLCSLALYAPVLIEFRDLITSPREIYAATRIGYGALFFVSTCVLYFAFILLLFSGRISRTYLWLFTFGACVILYLHGSKVQVLSLFLIGLYFLVFVKGRRFGFGRLIGLGVGVTSLVLTLFYVTFPATMKEDFVFSLASYAEATRFGAKVIDDPTLDPQLGRLVFENNFYGIVPRALVPDKPRDFGTFWLTSRYSPERFEAATGSPDFGIGVQYADFGVLAIVYIVLGQILAGVLLKLLVTRLKVQPDAGTFVLLLVFMGVPLLPTGSGVPLIVYFALAHFAKAFSRDQPASLTGTVVPTHTSRVHS
jgi:hypothetical protein